MSAPMPTLPDTGAEITVPASPTVIPGPMLIRSEMAVADDNPALPTGMLAHMPILQGMGAVDVADDNPASLTAIPGPMPTRSGMAGVAEAGAAAEAAA